MAIKLVARSTSLCFIGCDLSSDPTPTQTPTPTPAAGAAASGDGAGAGAGDGDGDGDGVEEPQPLTRSERLAARNADAADIIGAGAAIGRPELDLSSQFDHTFCMGTLGQCF